MATKKSLLKEIERIEDSIFALSTEPFSDGHPERVMELDEKLDLLYRKLSSFKLRNSLIELSSTDKVKFDSYDED